MKRHRSRSRGLTTFIVFALMLGCFGVIRTLAQRFGDAAALLIIVVFVPLVARLALHVESVARQRRRERVGKCECGYDVRATPDRCPECGCAYPLDGRARLLPSRGCAGIEEGSAGASPSPETISAT